MSSLSPKVVRDVTSPKEFASAPPVHGLQPGPCLLRAEGLRKAFGGQVILDGVDLEIRQGEVILLRGENGSGKTTLINILTGNLEPDAGRIHYLADDTPRSFRFPRRWWKELNPLDHFTPEFVAQEAVGRTWQDIRLFGTQSLRDNIAVAENNHPGENPLYALFAPGRSSRREAEIAHEADAMLARLGLAGREASSADKISIGQSKRVAIARAVAAGATILCLDEPLAGLDRQGISQVLNLLNSLVREGDVTPLIVEHVLNQSHLQGLITTDWLLAGGKLTASRPSSENCPPQAISRDSDTDQPDWFDLLAGADAEILDEPLPRGGMLRRIRRPEVSTNPPRPILEIQDLVVKRGERTVIGLDDKGKVSGLNLTLCDGEIAILQAPNGWGKTTLFAAVMGLIPIEKGHLSVGGRRLDGLPAWERRLRGIQALPADRQSFPNLSAQEILELSGQRSIPAGVHTFLNRTCSSLSGGERQKLALASVRPALVGLYDEPFSALDNLNLSSTLESDLLWIHLATLVLLPIQI